MKHILTISYLFRIMEYQWASNWIWDMWVCYTYAFKMKVANNLQNCNQISILNSEQINKKNQCSHHIFDFEIQVTNKNTCRIVFSSQNTLVPHTSTSESRTNWNLLNKWLSHADLSIPFNYFVLLYTTFRWQRSSVAFYFSV